MNYTSEDFRIQYISTYTLYIYTDQTNDQFVVIDDDNQIMMLMTYDRENPSQDAVKILGLPFSSVYVTLSHENLIWIPSEVFEQERLSVFSPFFDHADPSSIFPKDMGNLGVTALYELDPLSISRWRNVFSQAKFVPVFEVVLKQVQPQIPIKGNVLGVHVYDRQIDLFVFVDGTFRFYNTFEAATVDDLNYFVLQVFRNFDIGRQVEKVILSGADLKSEWAKCLTGYTKELELAKPKNRWFSASVAIEEKVGTLGVLVDSVLCAS